MRKAGVQCGYQEWMVTPSYKPYHEPEEIRIEDVKEAFRANHGIGKREHKSPYFYTNDGDTGKFSMLLGDKKYNKFRYRINTRTGIVSRNN